MAVRARSLHTVTNIEAKLQLASQVTQSMVKANTRARTRANTKVSVQTSGPGTRSRKAYTATHASAHTAAHASTCNGATDVITGAEGRVSQRCPAGRIGAGASSSTTSLCRRRRVPLHIQRAVACLGRPVPAARLPPAAREAAGLLAECAERRPEQAPERRSQWQNDWHGERAQAW